MKFTINKEHLLQQLTKDIRYDLIAAGVELPATFVFDGIPFDESTDEAIIKKYKSIYAALTPTEWNMFLEMQKKESGVEVHCLAKYTKGSRTMYSEYANSVAVHIKNMRISFVKNNIPMTIAIRRGIREASRYYLKKI